MRPAGAGGRLIVFLSVLAGCPSVEVDHASRDGAFDASPDEAHDADTERDTDAEGDASTEAGPSRELVVVTLNTHSFQEGLDSLDKLAWIGQGLADLDADLVGLNEVMSGTFWAYHFEGEQYDGAALIVEALEAASGATWYVARCGFAHWDDGEEMSNVTLSRFPLLEEGCRPLTTTDFWPGPEEQRNVLHARVAVPGFGPVNLFVTHAAGYGSVDVPAQIAEVRSLMVERSRGDERLELLLGDLNAPAGSTGYELWCHASPFDLVDTYSEANPTGFFDPTQVDGSDRIDYVMARDGPEPDAVGPYASSIVFDGDELRGAVLPIVSDHLGVVTIFELPGR